MANIGFVGLGHMGLPMACNLVKAGHKVRGYDLQVSVAPAFTAAGGEFVNNLEGLAEEQAVIVTMLQSGQQVQEVCLGASGLYQKTTAALHIDCSTIDIHSTQILHEQASKHHLAMIDAPVSGGVAGATAASLTFMVGGEEHAFNQAKPLLLAMGKKIFYTGSAGSGQAAKICNNMILGISMIAVSEAFVLAEALGLSAAHLFEVVNNASGQCWSLSNYAPVPHLLPDVPANHEYQAGFTAAMMLKDLKLSQEAAEATETKTLLGETALAIYQQFNDMGSGNLDFSAIIKTITTQRPRQ